MLKCATGVEDKSGYLLLEQWHFPDPDADPEIFPEASPESSCSWHLFLDGAAERGGFPPETVGPAGAAVKKIEPCFPFETLPSPVIADDMKDELDETLNSSSALLWLELRRFGFVKSRVMLCSG